MSPNNRVLLWNAVFLNLHLKFHLKNPLCFLLFQVYVKTESGQCPSTRKRQTGKMNILPKKEVLPPCMLTEKERQQDSSNFQKLGPHDSWKAVPPILIEQPVCVSLGSRHWGYRQRVWKTDGVPGLRSALGRLTQVTVHLFPILCPVTLRAGNKPVWVGLQHRNQQTFWVRCFIFHSESWLVSISQHTATYVLLDERGGANNKQWIHER